MRSKSGLIGSGWQQSIALILAFFCPSCLIGALTETETGGIMLCPLPGATTLKPGAACQPFFGIDVGLFDDHGNELPYIPGRESTGLLAIKRPWPGLARTILGDHQRYTEVYFSHFKRHKGIYVTGDNARRDADGYWWISGRADDVVNVSGHRVGSAEVESAIVTHQHAAEAAVVGMPHQVKGEALAAFVACNEGSPCSGSGSAPIDPAATARFEVEVRDTVAQEIGKLAVPDLVIVVKALPKTRSGKIMRSARTASLQLRRRAASAHAASCSAVSHGDDSQFSYRPLDCLCCALMSDIFIFFLFVSVVSCAASCLARPTRRVWATRRRWPTRPSSTTSSDRWRRRRQMSRPRRTSEQNYKHKERSSRRLLSCASASLTSS